MRRSELECERVIRLAHRQGMATATAYRGPEGGNSPLFVMVIDEPERLERFLPELQAEVPGYASRWSGRRLFIWRPRLLARGRIQTQTFPG